MDERSLQKQLEALKAQVQDLQEALAERDARIAELEEELKRRGKSYRPKPNRKHGGSRPGPGIFDEGWLCHPAMIQETCDVEQGDRRFHRVNTHPLICGSKGAGVSTGLTHTPSFEANVPIAPSVYLIF